MKTRKPTRRKSGFKSVRVSKIWPGTRYAPLTVLNTETCGTRPMNDTGLRSFAELVSKPGFEWNSQP